MATYRAFSLEGNAWRSTHSKMVNIHKVLLFRCMRITFLSSYDFSTLNVMGYQILAKSTIKVL